MLFASGYTSPHDLSNSPAAASWVPHPSRFVRRVRPLAVRAIRRPSSLLFLGTARGRESLTAASLRATRNPVILSLLAPRREECRRTCICCCLCAVAFALLPLRCCLCAVALRHLPCAVILSAAKDLSSCANSSLRVNHPPATTAIPAALVPEYAMVRSPAVAGRFYPGDPAELAQQVQTFTSAATEKLPVLGCMAPHAGYMYSGHVAGSVYGCIQVPSKCILLGPRHFPGGERMAILSNGSWETPLGQVPIDSALSNRIKTLCGYLREDSVAHAREHSLEVQLPFLLQLAPGLQFVPIVLATDRYEHLALLGEAVAQAVEAQNEPVLVVASSDMNHYESDEITRQKDRRAIDRILALDPRGLYDTVRSAGITMCGYAAATAMLVTMQKLGAKEATLVRYATSGDINGDRGQVVGYAGVVIR